MRQQPAWASESRKRLQEMTRPSQGPDKLGEPAGDRRVDGAGSEQHDRTAAPTAAPIRSAIDGEIGPTAHRAGMSS